MLFIAAAGSSGPKVRFFPLSCEADNVLSVAAPEPSSGVGALVAPSNPRPSNFKVGPCGGDTDIPAASAATPRM